MEYKLKVLSMHELGQRANQEDYMYPAPGMATDYDRCFVLCDGMGGHDSGEVASQTVCGAMGQYVKTHSSPDDVFTPEDLNAAVAAAYDALDARDTFAAKKMGTTMTFANFNAGGCLVAHMGDSRVYHLRPGMGILFETRDHSLVNDLIKVGELTEETAKDFGQKNVITRCLQPNTERRSRAEIREITDIRPGDYFFMCSDGVNEVMESRHIANVILDKSYSDEEKLQVIINSTVEARDNHTAFLIHVLDVKGAIVRRVPDAAPAAAFIPQPAVPHEEVVTPVEMPKKKMTGLYIGISVAAALLCGVGGFLLAPGVEESGDAPRKERREERIQRAIDEEEDVFEAEQNVAPRRNSRPVDGKETRGNEQQQAAPSLPSANQAGAIGNVVNVIDEYAGQEPILDGEDPKKTEENVTNALSGALNGVLQTGRNVNDAEAGKRNSDVRNQQMVTEAAAVASDAAEKNESQTSGATTVENDANSTSTSNSIEEAPPANTK